MIGAPYSLSGIADLFLLFLVFFLQDRGGGDGIVFVEPQQTHALRRAAGLADFVRVNADHFAVVRDDHHVRFFGNLQRGDDVTVTVRGLHVDDALAAARRDAVLRERRALAEAFLGHGQHQRYQRVFDLLVLEFLEILRGDLVFLGDDLEVRLDRVHAHDVVILVEVHTVHAAGIAAHWPYFRLTEKNRLAFVAGQENHFLAVSKLRADELILAVEGDSDDAGRARVGEFRQRRLLHRAALGGHENELVRFFQVARRGRWRQFFALLEFHKAGYRLAARSGGGFRQFVHLQPVVPALRSEQQNIAVLRSDEQMLD